MVNTKKAVIFVVKLSTTILKRLQAAKQTAFSDSEKFLIIFMRLYSYQNYFFKIRKRRFQTRWRSKLARTLATDFEQNH